MHSIIKNTIENRTNYNIYQGKNRFRNPEDVWMNGCELQNYDVYQ